jgi:hypothetical protein
MSSAESDVMPGFVLIDDIKGGWFETRMLMLLKVDCLQVTS